MKKALFLVASLALSATVHASYLYWTVDQTITMANTGKSFTIGSMSGSLKYAGATVHWLINGEEEDVLNYGTVGSGGQFVDSGSSLALPSKGSSTQYLVDLGTVTGDNTTAYSYYIEYMAYDASSKQYVQIGTGETKTYAQLSESIVNYDSGSLPISTATVWHGGTKNAPEPTSALLMLLGVAGLALKRKQRKAE